MYYFVGMALFPYRIKNTGIVLRRKYSVQYRGRGYRGG